MTDMDSLVDAVAEASARLIPELSERLRRHGLHEIEVAHGDLVLRVTASPATARTAPAGPDASRPRSESSAPHARASATPPGATPGERAGVGVSSPAVGFFVYADGLGPGLSVEKGDALGHVEMLGVRHEVRAPRRGTVRHLVAETGEAVEYGQVVVELEAVEAAPR